MAFDRNIRIDRCTETAPAAGHRGKQCVHNTFHIGACETEPVGDCKHGFMWHAEGREVRPVAFHAARHGIKWKAAG